MTAVDPAFAPFLVAGVIVGGIALLEVAALVVGLNLFAFLDDLIPDIDGTGQPGLFSWLGLGAVPFMVLVVVILSCFAVIGVGLQSAAMHAFGAPLPTGIASILAFVAGLPLASTLARRLAQWVRPVESSGVSAQALVGCRGAVMHGDTARGASVEVRVTGPKGARHWIRARAEAGARLKKGDAVRIVGGRDGGAVYVARAEGDGHVREMAG